jgi:hypothetical protein
MKYLYAKIRDYYFYKWLRTKNIKHLDKYYFYSDKAYKKVNF